MSKATRDVLEHLRAEHAARLGIPLDRVDLVQMDLDVLLELGTLVDLDVRGISSFTRRATWEELGVPEEAARRARFTRGVKNLIPKPYIAAFRSLETRARRWLDAHSFDVTGFRPYRYVPFTAYEAWRKGHEKLVKEWEMLKLKLLFEYRFHLVPTLEEDFREAALEAARALRLRGKKREEFAAQVVERARAAMPSYQALCQGLTLDYRAGLLLSRARIEKELLAAAELEAKRRQALARARAAEAKAAHRERLLEEMRKAELEHYREQLRRMASPIAEVFHQLRAQMYEDAVAVLETMKKNDGKLIGPAVRRARSMVQTFRLLNALDDRGLEKLLDEIERQLTAAPSEKRSAQVEDTLRQIAHLTRRSAAEVRKLAAPSRWGALRL
ncbi:MAG TPA: hypothetical protein EYP09_01550 [Anaerolineae bacterium]|nr:hypothetical protein [Anaerolineae bacterium]